MSAASSEPRHLVKKKEKQQLKHEAFIDSAPYFFFIKKKLWGFLTLAPCLGLTSKTSPYSKVQRRRFNKRQREQVGGGLDAIRAVLSVIDHDDSPEQGGPVNEETREVHAPKAQPKTLQIGEGKAVSLRKNQRRRAL
jgi:ribosome biogenesis protein SLX9